MLDFHLNTLLYLLLVGRFPTFHPVNFYKKEYTVEQNKRLLV